MVELTKQEMPCLASLSKGKLNVGLWACIEGKMMGRAWVDKKEDPSIGIVSIADFCFLLGSNDESHQLSIKKLLEQAKGKILVPYSNYWSSFIEKHFLNNHKKYVRYAMKVNLDEFHRVKLKSFIDVVEKEFRIEKINENNYSKVLEDEFMSDCCSNFSSFEEFLSNGIGYIIINENEIISGASSYSYCNGAIDITIGTKEEYRKCGLALGCASKVILECLDRNIYPTWNAANIESVALAEKLGYHFHEDYYVYSIY